MQRAPGGQNFHDQRTEPARRVWASGLSLLRRSRAVARRTGGRKWGMDTTRSQPTREFLPPGSTTIEEFERIDMRVGRIVAAEPFPEARKPAYRLSIDFGPMGLRRSSAQLPRTYPLPEALVGRLVVAVVNFPVRRIAGFASEVLVLGALPTDGRIPLLSVDEGAQPGDRIG